MKIHDAMIAEICNLKATTTRQQCLTVNAHDAMIREMNDAVNTAWSKTHPQTNAAFKSKAPAAWPSGVTGQD